MKIATIGKSIRSIYAITLGVFQILLGQVGGLYTMFAEFVPQIWIFETKPLIWVVIQAGLLETYPLWSVWLYGIVFIAIGVVAFVRFSHLARLLSVAFFAANLSLFWLLYLWNNWGGLGEFIVGAVGYSLLMTVGIVVFLFWWPW